MSDLETMTLYAFRRNISMTKRFYVKNKVLSGIYLLVTTCLVLVATCGCKNKEILPKEESGYQVSPNSINISSDEVFNLIRSVVIEKGQELSEEEKKIILRSVPKTAQYQMAGTFGQYIWSWNLPTGRMIEVRYVGDLKSPIDTEKITVLFSNK